MKHNITKEYLEKEYLQSNRSIPQLSLYSGWSIKYIRRKLKDFNLRSKTLSQTGLQTYKEGRKRKLFCDFSFTEWNNELAYILGVYLGDGSLGNRMLVLSSIDIDFLEYFRENCLKAFGKVSSEIKLSRAGNGSSVKDIFITRLSSINVVKFLGIYKGYKLNGVPKLPFNFYIPFIQGLFDSELTVSILDHHLENGHFSKNRINFGMNNKDLVNFTRQILISFGIKCTNVISDLPHSNIWKYNINILDFCNSGIKLSIQRKMDKINKFRTICLAQKKTDGDM